MLFLLYCGRLPKAPTLFLLFLSLSTKTAWSPSSLWVSQKFVPPQPLAVTAVFSQSPSISFHSPAYDIFSMDAIRESVGFSLFSCMMPLAYKMNNLHSDTILLSSDNCCPTLFWRSCDALTFFRPGRYRYLSLHRIAGFPSDRCFLWISFSSLAGIAYLIRKNNKTE